MDSLEKKYGERTVGSTGLSIGTHLLTEAIEEFSSVKLYDDTRVVNKIKLNDYTVHIYNMYTILRNIINSYKDGNIPNMLREEDLMLDVIDEISNLQLLYMDTTAKLLFWAPDYEQVYTSLNRGKPKNENVTFQHHLLYRTFLLSNKETLSPNVTYTDYKLPVFEPGTKIMLTSSLDVDLLNVGEITLIESHTSAVISKSEFNRRYRSFGNNDLSMLPFMEDILYFIGDEVFILTAPVKIKRALLELAVANNWNIRTTKSKVVSDIAKNEFTRTYYSNFVRKYHKV